MNDASYSLEDIVQQAKDAESRRDWDGALASYGAALQRAEGIGDQFRSELLRKVGLIHYFRGDYDLAEPAFIESEVAAARGAAHFEQALALNCIGTVTQALGKLDEAEAIYVKAQTIAEQQGHSRIAVMLDQNLGTLANIRGDSDAAIQRYAAALTRYEKMQDQEGVCWTLNNIGMAYSDRAEWEQAEQTFGRALDVAQHRNDAEMVGTVQVNRAELYLRRERFDDARKCCDQAFEVFGRIESKPGLGETYKLYGMLYRDSGKLQLAEAHLRVVVRLAEESGYTLLNAESESEYALLHLARTRNQEALKSLNRAHRLFTQMKANRELVDIEKQLDVLEERYLRVVKHWGNSIESKDHYTAGHCGRVAEYTCKLATAMGISGRDLTWMRMGAFLHDVGKTGVDAAILNKPGKLDNDEWEAMRRHTTIGDSIVSELGFPWDIRPLVRNHHEHWDGTGYPDGLAGENIPLNARILCVADVFDALTTTRSYRKPFGREEALRIMRQESGTTLDPQLFDTFTKVIEE
jgi:putative nucleotidyltransferase with HDIG domain